MQKHTEDHIIKNIRIFFKLKKESKAIKDIINRDIKTVSEQQQKDYGRLVRVGNFWNNVYVENESSGDRNKSVTVKEYLNEVQPYLRELTFKNSIRGKFS